MVGLLVVREFDSYPTIVPVRHRDLFGSRGTLSVPTGRWESVPTSPYLPRWELTLVTWDVETGPGPTRLVVHTLHRPFGTGDVRSRLVGSFGSPYVFVEPFRVVRTGVSGSRGDAPSVSGARGVCSPSLGPSSPGSLP